MARLDKLQRFQWLAEPVPRDGDARQERRFLPPIVLFRGARHARRSLAARDYNDFPACRSFREVARQAFCGQRCRDGGLEKGLEKASGVERHDKHPLLWSGFSIAEATASLERLILELSRLPESMAWLCVCGGGLAKRLELPHPEVALTSHASQRVMFTPAETHRRFLQNPDCPH
jgi:hypothetical protein